MKLKNIWILLLLCYNPLHGQIQSVDTIQVKADLEKILLNLETKYVYYSQKEVDKKCLKTYYTSQVGTLKNETEVLLFFENLLNEFYDSHLHLRSNTKESYRLSSPLYAETQGDKTIITSFWKDQIKGSLGIDLIGSEIQTINGEDFSKAIENFPTHCQNKSNAVVRTWVANKVLAGKYSEPRIITLKTRAGNIETLDMDSIKMIHHDALISAVVQDDIGIIRFHNSLGRSKTKKDFKKALKQLESSKGIIIDLRNTVDGGTTGVANPIAGHFTDKKRVFQKYKNADTQFVDYIKPHRPLWDKPLVIVVGRWTGSMGEGLASGFNGCNIGKVVGTEMQKLAGATRGYRFLHYNFGYQMPYIDVLQQNNVPRENFAPEYKVVCTNDSKDEFILEAIRLINEEALDK